MTQSHMVNAAYGALCERVNLFGSRRKTRILLHTNIRRALHLPPHAMRFMTTGNQAIRLGPAFAIYALSKAKGRRFGQQQTLFQDVSRLGARLGMDIFVITPGAVRAGVHVVSGYRFREGVWREETCPYPDIVWRRLTSRPRALQAKLIEDETVFSEMPQITLPRSMSEKGVMHQRVLTRAPFSSHVPQTKIAHNEETLIACVDAFDDCYVKPARGTQGIGIARLRRTRGGHEFLRDGAPASKISLPELALWYASFFRVGERVIVQETIPLLHTMDKRPLDFRCLVQAVNGRPVATALIARVGSPQSITTNLHTGGEAVSAQDLLPRLTASQASAMPAEFRRAESLACDLFEMLQRQHGELGEVGIDFAFDQNLRIYILEINPCPGRRMLRNVDPRLRMHSITRILEHALCITGYETIKS
ncbi:YheC/YheD family protein [Ferroacidibacillus organovorans]|uniref:ATP-grasp domain-containing protein n=1 Tax=Ferroacidibacillus organovorans TaxID=1765683 RepID=A0A853K961_9BACL|nr:YheC/YheD family protein [Ferroacidibacillus organovorans]KYP82164.1 hypothetical protein AYJ22_00480 [Ferroacidibacillus organovorans]OAG93592.1 hypothetical protein AYW79_09905 [Ferroacidibacillus organovorans]